MVNRLLLALARFAPTRFALALAVTVYALVRTLPHHVRTNVKRLTPPAPRKRTTDDYNTMANAAHRRSKKGRARFSREVLARLGQLQRNAHARELYLTALRDLIGRGEALTAARRAEARAIASAPIHELRKATVGNVPPVLRPLGASPELPVAA